jgi:U4/U6 small nuclear ribonucleoprotein PRP4
MADFPLSRYQIVTGAGDDTIRIWDMRSLRAVYTVPAHRSNVSDVRFFQPHHSTFPLADMKMDDGNKSGNGDPDVRDSDADIEEIRYKPGLYFASAGYDGLVKIWSADDWQCLRTLSADAGKVMSVDISPDGQHIVSGTYNRNFHLYAPEEVSPVS